MSEREKAWAAVRSYPAVRSAIRETEALPDGALRLRLIGMVYWEKSHSLEGAAQACHVSTATAKRWRRCFIEAVMSPQKN